MAQLLDIEREARALLSPLLAISRATPWGLTRASLRELPEVQALLHADAEVRAAAYLLAWELRAQSRLGLYSRNGDLLCGLLEDSGLALRPPQVLRAVEAAAGVSFHQRPGVTPLIAYLRTALEQAPSPALEAACRSLRANIALFSGVDPRIRVLDTLLQEERAWDAADAWGQCVDTLLAGHPHAELWQALLVHCASTGDRSRPTKKWLKAAAPMVAAIPSFDDDFARLCAACVMGPVFEAFPTYGPENPEGMRRQNRLTLRALVWAAVRADPQRTGRSVADLAQRCFKKISGWGAGAQKLGNGCLWTLGELPETAGVAWLSRLAGRVRYKQALALIEKALTKAAERAGVSRDEVEEMSLPRLGLDPQGQDRIDFGQHHALLAVEGTRKATLTWFSGDKALRGVPKAVKEAHPEALKTLKARHKELGALMAGQVDRLERLYLQDRDWSLVTWTERYLRHPLLAALTRRLIWQVDDQALLPVDGGFIDASGQTVRVSETSRVRLWHPIDAPELALAWRAQLRARGLQQPFRQAHRACYHLTPAEREAGDRSARFAGHVIRQHQFMALARQRAWTYTLQGPWDSHNTPTRAVGRWQIAWSVQGLEDDDGAPTGFPFLSTGHLTLSLEDARQPLEELPPLLFSELLRDVDLFVGVCSVGTDPDWATRDFANPHDLERWQGWASGALSEQAKVRRDVLAELIPVLKIGPKLRLDGRFLAVQGQQRHYKIHLGSANIFMEPGGYLCVVASPKRTKPVALPFEGDAVLSLILSKALLLVNDHKIKDMSIRQQLTWHRAEPD